MITLLSPPRLVGMMMGVWFFSQAAAFALSGTLANLAAVPEKVSPIYSMPYYHHAFYLFGVITLIFSIICFSIIPFLKKMINENTFAS
jgi:POT family proton-dependent oligopeptide transporter